MERNSLMKKITILPLLRESWEIAEDKTGADRKIRHGHFGIAGRKFVFNTAEPCPNALMFSPRPPYGNDTRGRSFYLQEHV